MRSQILAALLSVVLLPLVSASTIENPANLSIDHLFPFLIAFLTALILWKWMIPTQLSGLQVGFEIDDGLYEVHSLTKGRGGVKKLLKLPNVGFGIALYMMAMTGVLLLIAELVFEPEVYYLPNILLMGLLVLIPILISPWESLNGQLVGRRVGIGKTKFFRLFFRRSGTLIGLFLLSIGSYLLLLPRVTDEQKPLALAIAGLVFMGPTILAYGRIMGASWNMLMIGKYRTWLGRPNPIDAKKLGFIGRAFAFILILFLLTMPLTAINGIVTVAYVMINNPDNSQEVLNYGGILGHQVYLQIQENPLLAEWEALKSLPEILAAYLSLNIAIVGLAFIFELIRNLFLGGQAFGGLGGVLLASPREIRSEDRAQARVLYFAFAGFSGYTALLLILVCYKEFGDLMPFIDWFENSGFDEKNRLLVTWIFIAVGQSIFLLTWVLSVAKFNSLRNLKFDLNPDQRREGAIMSGGGNWMSDLVADAALNNDLDALIRFQERSIGEDEAIVRMAKSRARMLEMAIRGLWPTAIEEAKKVLAQAGGDDDEARMIVAAGHIACRRLDAAREALHNLQQPEGYDEPELLAFICEWFDPWNGTVDEDDLWDWENNPCIDHLNDLMRMLRSWSPQPTDGSLHKDSLTLNARLSHVALLRAQNKHKEAMDISLRLVREYPLMAKPRIAAALCLIDKGEWHSAMSVLTELEETDPYDPRVKALANILGRPKSDYNDELEVALTNSATKRSRKWIDDAPVNPVAALMLKSGVDEALNANILIAAASAVERKMTPRYTSGIISQVFNWGVLTPLWILAGIYVSGEVGMLQGWSVALGSIFLHQSARRFSKQQSRVIRHRDQKAMVAYAKRIKRHKINLSRSELPVGTHLLLSGMLLTINGIVYDIGLPGWLTNYVSKDSERSVRPKLVRRANAMKREKDSRSQNLSPGWWLKRPKEVGSEVPAMERLVGPVAYRGRSQLIQRKSGKAGKPTGRSRTKSNIMSSDLTRKGIPHNTIRSEKQNRATNNRGPRRPS
ncbi:MAG: tetratricopeptide repeat protein [Candidatus Poseidoniales archaeon]|nr:MAG: tetratricopeptide repeat protein [Candidatus Poseidoniales archaeon]